MFRSSPGANLTNCWINARSFFVRHRRHFRKVVSQLGVTKVKTIRVPLPQLAHCFLSSWSRLMRNEESGSRRVVSDSKAVLVHDLRPCSAGAPVPPEPAFTPKTRHLPVIDPPRGCMDSGPGPGTTVIRPCHHSQW